MYLPCLDLCSLIVRGVCVATRPMMKCECKTRLSAGSRRNGPPSVLGKSNYTAVPHFSDLSPRTHFFSTMIISPGSPGSSQRRRDANKGLLYLFRLVREDDALGAAPRTSFLRAQSPRVWRTTSPQCWAASKRSYKSKKKKKTRRTKHARALPTTPHHHAVFT